ncbi:LamG domain-containing protein [Streptomyces sp. YC504]|uniref:LamG domain-containing protein n=1 Tax=Streptomyces mesophilus TaxID=1775132 RepID=A0A6G4XQP8_9ACTN|nr:LamG domain-containing protein [Streptomyces mesophilus]NGO79137.1 LamG domain-containing protein [Streptomyces mesophilus]
MRARRSGFGAGCLVVATVLGLPGAAVAAEEPNLPPLQPVVADLLTGFKACEAGGSRPFVGQIPRVQATLYDGEPPNETGGTTPVSGEFEAWWEGADGAEQRRTYTTYTSYSGHRFDWQLPADLPADTVISWRVRVNDGQVVSPWSDEGAGTACEFVYDDENPQPPTVQSDEYPEEVWTDGQGVYGTFTVDSPSDDVVEYGYSFLGGPLETVKADGLGGKASIRHLPLTNGSDRLTVYSVDRSGRRSASETYYFYVARGRAPVAQWKLADAQGSKQAAAETGPVARAGVGVTFGAPALEGTDLTTTAALDGTGHGFLTPDVSVVDTTKTFAVSGWVRPGRTDRAMTLASQDAGQAPGFTLGLRAPGGSPVWSFDFGGARVTGGAPETGEWAHVLGLYDAETGLAQLYVNGKPVGGGQQAEASATTGNFQIGRVRGKEGYRDRWQGEIGNVRVHDRVVVPEELERLSLRNPVERGHWALEAVDADSSPELHGGQALTVGGGASLYRLPSDACDPGVDPECIPLPAPLVGDGHLDLDGETGYAATQAPAVDTGDSFSVGVRVRLADRDADRPMTVLSQGGEHQDAFKVRYLPATHEWQLVVTDADAPGAGETVVSHRAAQDGGVGDGRFLTVVYDDAADRIALYMDGHSNDEASATLAKTWKSEGPLQVGRAKTADGWGEYLHGSVDEVRAYSGALTEGQIAFLGAGSDFTPQ